MRRRRRLSLGLAFVCLGLGYGCDAGPDTLEPPRDPELAGRAPAATATALLILSLSADGSAALTAAGIKPIPFNSPGVSFDPELHAPAPGAAKLPSASAAGRPDADLGGGEGGMLEPRVGSTAAVHPEEPWASALVVRQAALSEPFVLPLDLGQPGEGGGDVLDRWQSGSVVVRAPYFGEGTRYALVRTRPTPVLLAEHEVQP